MTNTTWNKPPSDDGNLSYDIVMQMSEHLKKMPKVVNNIRLNNIADYQRTVELLKEIEVYDPWSPYDIPRPLGSILGINVYVDEKNVPPGVMRLYYKDELLKEFKLI